MPETPHSPLNAESVSGAEPVSEATARRKKAGKVTISKKIVIADVSRAVEEKARDIADARMTGSKESVSGFKGFFRKLWRHNLAENYFRTNEVNRARQEILDSENLFTDEEKDRKAHEESMRAVVDQFASEYEKEVIHEGELKGKLGDATPQEKAAKKAVKDLVLKYSAEKDLTSPEVIARFKADRARVLGEVKGAGAKDAAGAAIIDRGEMYADNLLDVAKEVQQAIAHGTALEDLDLDLDVVVGNARNSVRTEADFRRTDKIVEWMRKNGFFKFANETTLSTVVAIAGSAFMWGGRRVVSSKAAAWGTLGATAVVGGVFAGARENARLKEKRRQHAREMASGKKFDPDRSPRRKEMEEFRLETRSANELADAIENSIYRTNEQGVREVRDLTQPELDAAFGHLAEVESRIRLSDRTKDPDNKGVANIDLISYSDAKRISQERLRLDILRAEAKVDLGKLVSGKIRKMSAGEPFNYAISGLAEKETVKDFLESSAFTSETDPFKRKQLIAYWIHEKRLDKKFVVEEIERTCGSFTAKSAEEYAKWDWFRGEEALDALANVKPGSEIVFGKGLAVPNGMTVESYVASLSGTRIDQLIKGDAGIEKKNALFNKMKNKRVFWAVMKGLGTGLVIGGAFQEARSFFTDEHGLLTGAKIPEAGGKEHYTPLAGLWRYFHGESPSTGPHAPDFSAKLHDVVVGGHATRIPEGFSVRPEGDHSVLFDDKGVRIGNIKVGADGVMDPQSAKALAEHGFHVQDHIYTPNQAGVHEVLVGDQKVHIPDGTELKTEGDHYALLDAKGNKISDVRFTGHGAFDDETAKSLGAKGYKIEDHVFSEKGGAVMKEVFIDDNCQVKIPEGASLERDGDYFIYRDAAGNEVARMQFDEHGALTPESIKALETNDCKIFDSVTDRTHTVSPDDYFKGKLDVHARIDWHDEPGERFSKFFNKLIEFEGKQQMLYLQKGADGMVYINADKIVNNMVRNLDGAFKEFGTNPDGSVDTQLKHMYDELLRWKSDGTLREHLQAAIIPTEEANKKGLSMLIEGAGAGNLIPLGKDASALFTTPESLTYGHHPFRFMELRLGGHVFATTIGEDMKDMTITDQIHNPSLCPPGTIGNIPHIVPLAPMPTHVPEVVPPLGEDWDILPPPIIPLRWRTPLEPTKPEKKGGGYYPNYPEVPAEERERMMEDMSPRLRENPDAVLDPSVEIPWYFQDQERRNPGYVAALEQLNGQEKERGGENVEAAIALAVAGHQEHNNIYRTLETYAVQVTKGKTKESVWKGKDSQYEILIYVNWPKGTNPEKTFREIRRFRKKYPNIPVRMYREEITNGKVEVGFYKKKVFDIALLRHKNRGTKKDLLIIANDADMTYTSPTYLEETRQFMNGSENSSVDAMLGRQDLDPEVYEKNPTFHAALRFWQFMEAAIRAKQKEVGTQGRNTVMRGSVYAAIGGNRTRDFWGDIELGRLVRAGRNGNKTIAFLNRAWVMVDPRRELDKFKSGELVANTWLDFNERQGVRGTTKSEHRSPEGIDVDQLATLLESDPLVTRFRQRLEDEVNGIVYAFGGGGGQETYLGAGGSASKEKILRQAANRLGIQVNLIPEGGGFKVKIESTQKLREGLRDYKTKNRKNTKIGKHPLKGAR